MSADAGLRGHGVAQPDLASRIAIIGELGTAVRTQQGFSVVLYPNLLNWLVR